VVTPLRWRLATLDDAPLLARLNKELTEDEGHRNRCQSLDWFAARMEGFLQGEYTAVIFEQESEAVAYALFCPTPDRERTVYLRQLYVARGCRRQGLGREALRLLRAEVWPRGTRVTAEVLPHNATARAFYAALGFDEAYLGLELRDE